MTATIRYKWSSVYTYIREPASTDSRDYVYKLYPSICRIDAVCATCQGEPETRLAFDLPITFKASCVDSETVSCSDVSYFWSLARVSSYSIANPTPMTSVCRSFTMTEIEAKRTKSTSQANSYQSHMNSSVDDSKRDTPRNIPRNVPHWQYRYHQSGFLF